jgi:hypothetical protein
MKLLLPLLLLGCSASPAPTLHVKNNTPLAYYLTLQGRKQLVHPNKETSLRLNSEGDEFTVTLQRQWPGFFNFLLGRYGKLRTKDHIRGLGLRVRLHGDMPSDQLRGSTTLTIASPCLRNLIASLEADLLPA